MDDVPCAVFLEMITDYLDGAIPSELRARVDAHLALCPGCTSVREQVRRIIRLAGASPTTTSRRSRLRTVTGSWPPFAPPGTRTDARIAETSQNLPRG